MVDPSITVLDGSLNCLLCRRQGAATARSFLKDRSKMAELRSKTTMRLGLAFVLVLLGTPTCCNAARELRDRGPSDPRRSSEERQEFEKRSSNWSDRESGDDAVPTSSSPLSAVNYAANFNRWVRFQEEHETADYANTPAAANPSTPCC